VKTKLNCLIAEKSRAEFVLAKYYNRDGKGGNRPIMRISQESFLLAPTGWIMRSDTDFIILSYLKDLFLDMKAHGLLQKIAEESAPSSYPGADSSSKGESLSMQYFGIVFDILMLGLGLGTVAFILELICSNCEDKIPNLVNRGTECDKKGWNISEYLP